MKILTRSILALSFLLLAHTIAKADEIYLQSVQSGKYVTEIDGTLAAATDRIDRARRFETVQLERNTMALRDVRSGSFVRAGVGKAALLAIGSPHIRGWETFEVVSFGRRDQVALRSVQNEKFVRAGVGKRSFLAAISREPSDWEMFRLVDARRPQDNADQRGGPDLREIVGHYRITHVAMDDGFLVELGQRIGGRARLSVDNRGVIRASVGCNMVSTSISLRKGRYRAEQNVMGTKMACSAPGQAEAEAGLIRAIETSRTLSREGRVVVFKAANGAELLKIRER